MQGGAAMRRVHPLLGLRGVAARVCRRPCSRPGKLAEWSAKSLFQIEKCTQGRSRWKHIPCNQGISPRSRWRPASQPEIKLAHQLVVVQLVGVAALERDLAVDDH